MTPVATFAGKRVALFGLGGSGLSTARALVAGGAEVAAWDDGEAARAKAAEVPLVDLARGRLVALRRARAVARRAADASEAALDGRARARRRASRSSATSNCSRASARARAPDAPFVAITGTNGKSTTTALIAHILREAGRDVQLGGNIGVPVLDLDAAGAGPRACHRMLDRSRSISRRRSARASACSST